MGARSKIAGKACDYSLRAGGRQCIRPSKAAQAVARDNLFFVPPELIQRHTPRLVDGAEILCRQLESARQRRSK